MHRIDGPGATVANLFTEGNPALSIPATVVTDDIMNDIQEEICNVIEDQGIALVKGTQDQLLTAIKSLIAFGGDSQLSQAIANNAGAANVTGLAFNKISIKGAIASFLAERVTATQNVQEVGKIFVVHDATDDIWRISVTSNLDDSGLTFTINSSGQVQVATSNLSGGSYSGTLRVTGIQQFKQ